MRSLTEKEIRTSLINASLRERNGVSLPEGFDSLKWDRLDYLGFRDRKIPSLGYVIVELDDEPVGLILRKADGKPASRAQCSWCEDIHLPNDVVLFSAKRVGQAGRNGNTVATLVCSEFQCSANVRKLPPIAYIGFDAEAARTRRIEALGEHSRAFVRGVRDGS